MDKKGIEDKMGWVEGVRGCERVCEGKGVKEGRKEGKRGEKGGGCVFRGWMSMGGSG